MLKNLSLENCELYLGRRAGKALEEDLARAEKSVRICSPYLTQDTIEALCRMSRTGVEVELITSTDFDKKNAASIYQAILKQIRHTDEDAKERSRKGVRYSGIFWWLCVIGIFAGIGVYFWKWEKLALWVGLACIPLGFLAAKISRYYSQIRVYTYSYKPRFPVRVIVTPYSGGFDDNHYLPHAKIFIIDDKVAYLGSLNLTRAGFEYNYESRLKTTDPNAIEALNREFEWLKCNNRTAYRDIEDFGPSVFAEPRR